jgi:hypothetical protein
LDQHERRSFNGGRTGQGVPLFDKNFDRTAYDRGRLVRSCETPWFKGNEQNNSRSHATSDSVSGISLVIALLLLVGFAIAGLLVIGVIRAVNSPQEPDNFTQGQAPPPRPAVYEVRRVSSTPVFVGAEGVDLRIRPDFGAKLSTCAGACPPGPRLANTAAIENGEYNGWVHLVADYTDGWAPPGSDIRPNPH